MTTQAQVPAEGVMLVKNYGNAHTYHIECECSDGDHAARMWIEVNVDAEIPDVEVSFYVTTWTPFWDKNFSRIRAAYEVLFKGVHRQEHHMILSKQGALNLAKALEQSVNELDRR
jgi:hypothetical protein